MEVVKITFSNGDEITAEKNGDSFILDKETQFPDNLEDITITEGESERVISHGRIIECASVDGKYWFSIDEVPEQERIIEEMQGNILYIAMMSDVDLDS